MISINGVVIPTPKSYEVGIQDIDGETNRNAAGYMCRDRIATKIMKAIRKDDTYMGYKWRRDKK